jgi:hypothetical protein
VSPLDIITVSLAETSIICRFVGSTDDLHTFVDRPWRIGNEGQGALASTGKNSRATGGGLSLPPARRAPLTAYAKRPALD